MWGRVIIATQGVLMPAGTFRWLGFLSVLKSCFRCGGRCGPPTRLPAACSQVSSRPAWALLNYVSFLCFLFRFCFILILMRSLCKYPFLEIQFWLVVWKIYLQVSPHIQSLLFWIECFFEMGFYPQSGFGLVWCSFPGNSVLRRSIWLRCIVPICA